MSEDKYITNAPEGIFDTWSDMVFSLENKMKPDSPERHRLYRIRSEIQTAKMLNRVDKDKPQDRWIYEKGTSHE